MNQSNKHRLAALKIVHGELRSIKFPTLERPKVYNDEPRTLELRNWAARIYCFSLLSHFRELLNSLILLSKAGHVPALFIISRCLYEIGAHSYYVQKHVKQYRSAKNGSGEWKFMQSINMGSLYMRDKTAASKDPFPEPRDIGKIIRSFREWPGGKSDEHVQEDYSYLSEYTHPNMAALTHYYKLERNAKGVGCAKFAAPQRDVHALPLPEVTFAVAATLVNLADLLSVVEEGDLAKKLKKSVFSLTKSKPKSFRARLGALRRFIGKTAVAVRVLDS